MNSEKTIWKWGEEAKVILNALSESSARANASVTIQLRNQTHMMLQSKIETLETNPLYDPDPLKSISSSIIIGFGHLIYYKYPEKKIAQILKDNADIQLSQANVRATKEIKAASEIKNLISLMKPNEISNLIKDLRDNTPLTEIALKLDTLRARVPLVKGTPIIIPEGELVKFLCPNCKGIVLAPFSEKPRILTCIKCWHKFESHSTTITFTNPYFREKKGQ